MEANKIMKTILWGVSAVVGIVVAEGVYQESSKAIEQKEPEENVDDLPF